MDCKYGSEKCKSCEHVWNCMNNDNSNKIAELTTLINKLVGHMTNLTQTVNLHDEALKRRDAEITLLKNQNKELKQINNSFEIENKTLKGVLKGYGKQNK